MTQTQPDNPRDAIGRLRRRLAVPTPPGLTLSALAAELDPAT